MLQFIDEITVKIVGPHVVFQTKASTGSTDKGVRENWSVGALKVDQLSQATGGSYHVIDNKDLHEFKQAVASISAQVLAIRAEKGEAGERHITTFISEDSESLEEKIIAAQAQIILKYPEKNYSFHIRAAQRNEDGKVWLPSGSYCLLTWELE